MKKFLALIIAFIFGTLQTTLAAAELYYLKGVQTSVVGTLVENNFTYQGFNIQKQNPYYGTNGEGDYAAVVLQQSGNNVFYYYKSKENTKINKGILKDLRRLGVEYELSQNSNIIAIYDRIAENTRSSVPTTYSFEEPVKLGNTTSVQKELSDDTTFRGYVAQLASGTAIPVYLQNAINTSTAAKGDQVIAVTTQNINHNGTTIIPQGSFVYGYLSKARNATYGSRSGAIVITFTQIVTPENKTYDISAETIDFTVTNDGKVAEAAKRAAVGAVVGALSGLLFAALGDTNMLTSVAVGAGVGAGSQVVISAAQKGADAEIPSFTELEVVLTRPLSVSVNY